MLRERDAAAEYSKRDSDSVEYLTFLPLDQLHKTKGPEAATGGIL